MTDCKTLLPQNNRTPLETALEQAQGCGMKNMPVPLRDLWRVDSCPAELLPWLAWTLSVDVWEDNWNEQQKRNVIRASVEIHKHKGTLYAVEQAIIALGVDAKITEWWQDKAHIGRGRFHIEINATDTGIDTGIKQQTLRRFIEHSKRLSALYAAFIKDSANLNIVANSALLSHLTDHSIPVLKQTATCLDATQISIGGHFKEEKYYQPFACVDAYKIALETSNKRHYYKPNLALRVTTHDIAIETDTRKEQRATLFVPMAMAGLARVENLTIRSEMVLEANNPVATTYQIQGHFQQKTNLATVFFAQNGADMGLLSSNQRLIQAKDNLALRIMSRNDIV